MSSLMPQENMPRTRRGRTVKLEIHNVTGGVQEGYLIANVDDAGNFKELFLQGFGKEGSTFYGWTQFAAILFSFGMQGQMDFGALALKVSHMKFEPYGPTNDPEIPYCYSVPDYIVRRLALWFGDDELKAALAKIAEEMSKP